jgi:hypothetical protein
LGADISDFLLDFGGRIRLYFVLRKTESGVGGETRQGLHPKGTVSNWLAAFGR